MEITIKGLKELDNALQRFPEELQRKVLADALRKSAKIMRDDAQERAPIRTADDGVYLKERKGGRVTAPGHLKAHILLKMRTINGIPTALIGWAKSAFWGMFDEFGTSHQAARPFMRPAFDSTYMQIIREFSFQFRLGVERAAKKFYQKVS